MRVFQPHNGFLIALLASGLALNTPAAALGMQDRETARPAAAQSGARTVRPAGESGRTATAVPAQEFQLSLEPRYIRVFHFRDYRSWPPYKSESYSSSEPLRLGGLENDNRTFFFVTNGANESAKIRFQAFRSNGQLMHESDMTLNPGYSTSALKFTLDSETANAPELFIITSNKPVLAYGWAARDYDYSRTNLEDDDYSSAARGLAMTELTPREIDCLTERAGHGWLCTRATSQNAW